MPTPAFVLTVSDRCFRGERQDQSGPAVAELLTQSGFHVTGRQTVPDDQPAIESALRAAAQTYPIVLTTGGTGLTPRDVTPEATSAVCTRLLDGIAEQMRAHGRQHTPFAVLSRGVCGVLGKSLILNLPGAPRGAATSLQAVLPVLQHALNLLADPHVSHPAEPSSLSAQQQESFTPEIKKAVEIPSPDA